jgi:hypothetical protein
LLPTLLTYMLEPQGLLSDDDRHDARLKRPR